MGEFHGLVALVTGGASGIGAATARCWSPRARLACPACADFPASLNVRVSEVPSGSQAAGTLDPTRG